MRTPAGANEHVEAVGGSSSVPSSDSLSRLAPEFVLVAEFFSTGRTDPGGLGHGSGSRPFRVRWSRPPSPDRSWSNRLGLGRRRRAAGGVERRGLLPAGPASW